MGDIAYNNGTGHTSHYPNNKYIKDEIDPKITFCESGLVAMANKGPNTNGSQFFITLDELPNLNNKYTIIGQAIKGFEELKQIAILCGNELENTKCNVKVSKTGVYDYNEYASNNNLKL